jgi:hypothetical protein
MRRSGVSCDQDFAKSTTSFFVGSVSMAPGATQLQVLHTGGKSHGRHADNLHPAAICKLILMTTSSPDFCTDFVHRPAEAANSASF